LSGDLSDIICVVTRIPALILAVSFLAWVAGCHGSADLRGSTVTETKFEAVYDATIRDLAAERGDAKNTAAWNGLTAAGSIAFPYLIRHFGDPELAGHIFQGDTIAMKKTVGDACFELIQMQVEGRLPKTWRKYYVLTPQNTAQWLAAHRQSSLEELRIAASRDQLACVQSVLAADPGNGSMQRKAEYFRKRYQRLSTGSDRGAAFYDPWWLNQP
jgi:hypothetical protein